jgi:hypothetical protein
MQGAQQAISEQQAAGELNAEQAQQARSKPYKI